ncbi:MAG: DUF1573 domain-containing protein [Chitinophagales bacterium]
MNKILVFCFLLSSILFTNNVKAQTGGYDYGVVGDPYEIGIASPDNSSVKLDTISIGDTIYHTFNIKNIGTGDLKFTKVKCNYGCDIMAYTQDSIPQGKSGIITAAVYYFNRTKQQNRYIDFSNDGKFKFLQLKLSVYIRE